MKKLSDFPLYTSASSNDLLLIWDSETLTTKVIKKSDLLASSGPSSGGSLANWTLVNANYVAVAGERLLIDTSNGSLTLTLPLAPTLSNEIEICGLKGLDKNKLSLSFEQSLYKGNKATQASYSSLYLPTKLIYTTADIGWIDTNNLINVAGNYSQEILKDLPFVYLRLNDLNGTVAKDSSINSRDCQYQGSIGYQQESSLSFDQNDKSVLFNGFDSRILINSQINAPIAYVLECKFKTTNSNGGLFGFYGGGYDRDLFLANGKLRLLNYNGADVVTSKSYNDGVWHIVSGLVNSRGTEIWIDGNLAISSPNFNTVVYSGNWFVGWGQYGGYFNGLIDEVSITHSEVSADRIKARHALAMG